MRYSQTNKAVGYGMSVEDFRQNTKLSLPWGYLPDVIKDCLDGTHELSWKMNAITGARGLGELFTIIELSEGSHLMIFPTLQYKIKWYRRHDEMDRISAGMTPLRGAVYLSDPIHHPYGMYMDRNGVEIDPPRIKGSDPATIPGVPPIMRWWLLRYGVFDLTGIAKLRPLLGEWWG